VISWIQIILLSKFNLYRYVVEETETLRERGAQSETRALEMELKRVTLELAEAGLSTSWMQFTHSLKARLVSTLEPINWKTGFKICFQWVNLYRYAEAKENIAQQDRLLNPPLDELLTAVGLCVLNAVDP
jgi:hypothetical protein